MTTHADFLNLKQMAEAALGEASKESTIRLWAKDFGIEPVDTGKERLFDPRLVPVFAQIKALKDQKQKREEIQSNVNRALTEIGMPIKAAEPEAGPHLGDVLSTLQTFGQQLQQQGEALQDAALAKIEHGLREHSDLAQRLADSERERGQIEVLLEGVKHQLSQAQQQVLLLPEATAARAELEAKAEGLAAELATAEQAAQAQADAADRMRAQAEADAQARAEAEKAAQVAELARQQAEANARTQQDEVQRMRQELDEAKAAKAEAEGRASERASELERERKALLETAAELKREQTKGFWARLLGPKKE